MVDNGNRTNLMTGVLQMMMGTVASGQIMLPAASIILYEGTVASIPSPWVFCNGSNSTPDLRNKYIRGADGSTIALNATGGATTAQITGTSSTDGAHSDIFGCASNGGGAQSRNGPGNSAHAHSLAGDMDWKPPSREVIAIRTPIEASLPANAVVWINGTLANGCTALTAMQNRFALCVTADSRTQVGSDNRAMTVSVTSGGSHSHTGIAGYDAPGGGGGIIQIPAGAHVHTSISDTIAINKPPYVALLCATVDSATGAFTSLVIGYNGSLASIPSTWKLCDGTNSTRDLVGKSPIGSGGSFILGATGGSSSNQSITGTGSVASATVVHNHGVPTEEGAQADHSSYSWTHSHASWSGTATVMPPWHALYMIEYKG